jgi:hypothetical protein
MLKADNLPNVLQARPIENLELNWLLQFMPKNAKQKMRLTFAKSKES